MTKVELAQVIASKHNISQTLAKDIINTIQVAQSKDLLAGHDVLLDGIGKIKISQHRARNYRNPRTGELFAKPAKLTVRLQPSITILRDLNA